MLRQRIVLLTVWAALSATSAFAADWPQFLGPNRDGHSPETGLLKEWPAGGPKLKWKIVDLGNADAFSAPSVAHGRIYVLCAAAGLEEIAVALDEKDGKKVWSAPIGKAGKNKSGYPYEGPRSTPTVDGDKLYILSSGGNLICLDAAKGTKVWSKSLQSDFGGAPGWWAYCESPLVDGDVLVVTPGGTTATIAALNKKDGSVIWKASVPAGGGGKGGKGGMGGAGGPKAGYGSPIRIEVGGVKQYVSVLETGLVGVSASDGKYLWRYDKPSNGQGINIATPLFHDGLVFDVSGYNTGGGVAKLTADQGKVTAKEAWFSKDLATSQSIGTFVRVGDYIYGTAAAGKGGKGGGIQLVCVELKTGNIVWKNPTVGAQGALCVADGMLYVRGEKGKTLLVEATPSGYKEHGNFNPPRPSTKRPAWPYPVVANGCLYLRDMGTLLCYDIRDAKK